LLPPFPRRDLAITVWRPVPGSQPQPCPPPDTARLCPPNGSLRPAKGPPRALLTALSPSANCDARPSASDSLRDVGCRSTDVAGSEGVAVDTADLRVARSAAPRRCVTGGPRCRVTGAGAARG